MSSSCYVCGSAELAPDADPRNPTCERCRPAREHVVSMQTDRGTGEALAVCPCGWGSRHAWADRPSRCAAVRAHWREVIEAAG